MPIDLITALRKAGWRISEGSAPLPARIRARYSWVPAEILAVLEGMTEAVNHSETAWLLSAAATLRGGRYRWNEWELVSLEAAGSDLDWANEISAFWDSHFPFLLSVKDGYAYFAIRQAPGFPVVYGREPEFEQTEAIAGSFDAWVEAVSAVLERRERPLAIETAL